MIGREGAAYLFKDPDGSKSSSERRTLVSSAHPFRPEEWLRFVHLSAFSQDWSRFGLGDDDLRALEVMIMLAPGGHPVIPGSGGLRKIRFARSGGHRGKSGSFRVFYAFFPEYRVAALVAVIGKGERSDLPRAELNAAAELIREIRALLDKGIAR